MAKIDSVWDSDIVWEELGEGTNTRKIESTEIYGTSRRCQEAVRRVREWNIQSWDLDKAFPGLL